MSTHSSILAWRIPWTEDPGGLHPWVCKESDMTEQLSHTHTHTHTVVYHSQSGPGYVFLVGRHLSSE